MEMEAGEASRRRRPRLELFSVELHLSESLRGRGCRCEDVFGVVLVDSCDILSIMFDSSVRDPPQISPEGLLTLISPKYSIPLDYAIENEDDEEDDEEEEEDDDEDEHGVVRLRSWFVIASTCDTASSRIVLWKPKKDPMNLLICKRFPLDLDTSCFDVSFAIYSDPVEAHFNVFFLHVNVEKEGESEPAPIRVHGTITVANSSLHSPQARSSLFRRLERESLFLQAGSSVPLALSRNMTVVPRRSTVHVHVNLNLCTGHGEEWTLEGKVNFNSQLTDGFMNLPSGGKFLLKVNWAECDDSLEYIYQSDE